MMITYKMEAPKSGAICDFCGDEPAWTVFACEDFMFMKNSHIPQHSEGGWAACCCCAEFINAGSWSDLTDRAFNVFVDRYSVPFIEQPALRLQFMEIHKRFRSHMRPIV